MSTPAVDPKKLKDAYRLLSQELSPKLKGFKSLGTMGGSMVGGGIGLGKGVYNAFEELENLSPEEKENMELSDKLKTYLLHAGKSGGMGAALGGSLGFLSGAYNKNNAIKGQLKQFGNEAMKDPSLAENFDATDAKNWIKTFVMPAIKEEHLTSDGIFTNPNYIDTVKDELNIGPSNFLKTMKEKLFNKSAQMTELEKKAFLGTLGRKLQAAKALFGGAKKAKGIYDTAPNVMNLLGSAVGESSKNIPELLETMQGAANPFSYLGSNPEVKKMLMLKALKGGALSGGGIGAGVGAAGGLAKSVIDSYGAPETDEYGNPIEKDPSYLKNILGGAAAGLGVGGGIGGFRGARGAGRTYMQDGMHRLSENFKHMAPQALGRIGAAAQKIVPDVPMDKLMQAAGQDTVAYLKRMLAEKGPGAIQEVFKKNPELAKKLADQAGLQVRGVNHKSWLDYLGDYGAGIGAMGFPG